MVLLLPVALSMVGCSKNRIEYPSVLFMGPRQMDQWIHCSRSCPFFPLAAVCQLKEGTRARRPPLPSDPFFPAYSILSVIPADSENTGGNTEPLQRAVTDGMRLHIEPGNVLSNTDVPDSHHANFLDAKN